MLGKPDVRLLRAIFPDADVFEQERWTVAEVSADQVIVLTAHDGVDFVEDDGEGAQTWSYQDRTFVCRTDPDAHRIYLAPSDNE